MNIDNPDRAQGYVEAKRAFRDGIMETQACLQSLGLGPYAVELINFLVSRFSDKFVEDPDSWLPGQPIESYSRIVTVGQLFENLEGRKAVPLGTAKKRNDELALLRRADTRRFSPYTKDEDIEWGRHLAYPERVRTLGADGMMRRPSKPVEE